MSYEFLITFLASFLIWFMFAGVFVFWVIRKDLKTAQVLHIFAGVFIAFLFAQLIKEVIPTQRPFVVSGINPLTVTIPDDSSFPSAHTSIAFALMFGIIQHNKRLGIAFFPPALLVGVGRITSHVHTPLDVIGGIFIALIVAIIFGHQRLKKFFDRAWITS